MFEVNFYFQGSKRFIKIGQVAENQDRAKSIAEKFAKWNCSSWSWSNGKDLLIRGKSKTEPIIDILISVTGER